MTWRPYSLVYPGPNTVVGDVGVYPGVESPELGNRRNVLVYLPPSYRVGGSRRYPVVYMQDGQNLFDAVTSFAGEWCVDETMEALAAEGLEAIVVGVPNAGEARRDEYSPYRDTRNGGGRGDLYLRFLTTTVRPLVERSFRVHPARYGRAIMGSSMGGLISLYALFACPEEYGLVGAMSPALWFARGRLLGYVGRRPPILGRIYLDMGTAEGELPSTRGERWLRTLLSRSTTLADVMANLLVEKGYHPGRDLHYVLEQGAPHHESAWARRLPDALRWLLANSQ